MQWINESDLAKWANRIDARALLPDMIADLIRATITDAARFRFPGGDVSQVRGWDGSLETAEAAEFVPAGKSKWEFGSGAGAKKASSDYEKRTLKTSAEEMAENTLVVVNLEPWDTPRNQLTAWEDDRRGEKKWRDVRYLDAVELVHWLDRHPAVAAIYARSVLNCAPKDGVLSTDEFWDMYSARFNPRLSEKVVISDRQSTADDLLKKLAGPAQLIMLGAEASDEVVAFAVAAIRLAQPEVRRALEVKTLIVESESAARFLSKHNNLTFITTKAADSMAGILAEQGVTLSAATGVQARKHTTLQRPSASSMAEGFIDMGLEREEGYELAHRCGRSLTILQRLIPKGRYSDPAWTHQAIDLKPAFLAGGWSAGVELDKDVLKDLSGLANYFELESRLLPTLALSDPPFDRVGEIWQVRAPVDAFSFYGHMVSSVDLERLRTAALKVFSHVISEPSLEEKFSASYVSNADYSKWLRDGLALTLLILATMDKVGRLQTNNVTPQRYVDEILDSLPEWGKNHRTLIGLGDQIALIAEAAPNPFLRALESMLEGDRSEIAKIFAADGDSVFGPSSPHIRVLWALETLAWDPKLLNRVALILARLAELDPDPDSRMVNRPINSLRTILLTWSPNTHASQKQRIACVDLVINASRNIGWQLIVKLLPRSHDTSSSTSTPSLRDFSPREKEVLTFGLVWEAQHAIVSRAMQLASDDEDRIILLVKSFSSFNPEDRMAVIRFLDNYLGRQDSDKRSAVWYELSSEFSRHEFFSDSDWAMQDGERKTIANILSVYSPKDPLLLNRRLFDDWLPYVGRHKDSENVDPDLPRIEVLEQILTQDGSSGILRLARIAKLPNLIGPLLNRISISQEQLLELVEGSIGDPPTPGDLGTYASAVGANQFQSSWPALFRSKILPLLKLPAQTASLLVGWPLGFNTWDFVKSLGGEVYDAYWRRVHMLPTTESPELMIQAIQEFRRVSRSVEVLALAHRKIEFLPTELIFSLLDESLTQISKNNMQNGTMLSYYLNAAFSTLQARADAPREKIARLEYAYFPLLENEKKPLVLHDFLSRDANFFVEILSHVFRGKNSQPKAEVTPEERNRGQVSYRLLSSFKTVPGSSNGVINRDELQAWVIKARNAATKLDLTDITDQYIGHVLAHASTDSSEGFWPPSPVCQVIEAMAANEIETGIEVECFNKRGVFSKAMHEGGAQERVLAAKYSQWAGETISYPRTSALLLRISESWTRHAEREDTRAETDKMKR